MLANATTRVAGTDNYLAVLRFPFGNNYIRRNKSTILL